MQITVLWVGRPAACPYTDEIVTYQKRVARRWRPRDVALRPAARGRDGQERALAAEAERLRRRLPTPGRTVALDERGTSVTSATFAARLSRWEEAAVPEVAFIVGGDLGLAPELVAETDATLCLGPMTLPHHLARLILWEQLYRAVDILSGGRYHRGGVQS